MINLDYTGRTQMRFRKLSSIFSNLQMLLTIQSPLLENCSKLISFTTLFPLQVILIFFLTKPFIYCYIQLIKSFSNIIGSNLETAKSLPCFLLDNFFLIMLLRFSDMFIIRKRLHLFFIFCMVEGQTNFLLFFILNLKLQIDTGFASAVLSSRTITLNFYVAFGPTSLISVNRVAI